MKIMFVCTGNICRSAMAHAMLEKQLKENNRQNIKIYSCGTSAYQGDGATYNAIEAVKLYDVDLKSHRATAISNSEIEQMDLILCMTRSHKQIVLQRYPQLAQRVYTLKEYTNYRERVDDIDIPDPWGYDIETYRRCAEEIEVCIELLMKKLEK